MAHPEHTQRLPALRLEVDLQRLRGGDHIEVHAPVGESRERLISERDQSIHTHPRVVFDPDHVEVVVARVSRRPRDRAVRPRLEDVTDGGVRGVVPVPGAGRDVSRLAPISAAGRG